jgi:hypothetical protein
VAIQSSFSWNSGSVENSHMCRSCRIVPGLA